jgi:hypothetical protein
VRLRHFQGGWEQNNDHARPGLYTVLGICAGEMSPPAPLLPLRSSFATGGRKTGGIIKGPARKMVDHISLASMSNLASRPDAPDPDPGSGRLTRRSMGRSNRGPASSALSRGNVMYLASVGVIAVAMAGVFFGTGYTLLAARAGGASIGSSPREPDRQAVIFSTISLVPPPAGSSDGREVAPATEVFAQPEATTAAPPRPSPDPTLSATEISALLEHGDALLRIADIASARLFYERAANAGDGRAALRLGATFDPAFLERAGLRNLKGDAAAARSWYSRAVDLGGAKAAADSVETKQGR